MSKTDYAYRWQTLLNAGSTTPKAAREEVFSQLDLVPEPHRTRWKKRMVSPSDHKFYPAFLELYLFHIFAAKGWQTRIEPRLTANYYPDFMLDTPLGELAVEAKTILGSDAERNRARRAESLTQDLAAATGTPLRPTTTTNIPPRLPNWTIVRGALNQITAQTPTDRIPIQVNHQGRTYRVELTTAEPEPEPPATDLQAAQTRHTVHKSLLKKARKHQGTNAPFIIAAWPKLINPFSTPQDELATLFAQCQDSPLFSGLFTTRRQDLTLRCTHVSAVLFCRPHCKDPLRLYHNPWAVHPLNPHLFPDLPQCHTDRTSLIHSWATMLPA